MYVTELTEKEISENKNFCLEKEQLQTLIFVVLSTSIVIETIVVVGCSKKKNLVMLTLAVNRKRHGRAKRSF